MLTTQIHERGDSAIFSRGNTNAVAVVIDHKIVRHELRPIG
jgi:hypothetical protein